MRNMSYEVKRHQLIIDAASKLCVKSFDDRVYIETEFEALKECCGDGVQEVLACNFEQKWLQFSFYENPIPLNKFDAKKQTIFVQLLPQLINIVQHCHDCGWIHGDLKPSNILYLPKNKSIKLIDFGASQRIGVARKSLNEWQCTPLFASDEVLSGTGVCKPSDDWYAIIRLINQFLDSKPKFILAFKAKMYKCLIKRKMV
ncbi:protein kinase [Shewanella sp. OPT22]|nr:protein kinase [Shewanella sp. OPT22]